WQTAPSSFWASTNTGSIHPATLTDKVGIGTSNPTEMLEIRSTDSDVELETNDNTESSSIHLKRSEGTPGALSTFDNNGEFFGSIDFQGYSLGTYLSGASIRGLLDGTPASTSVPGALAFYTSDGVSSIPTERMRIDKEGNVGIGTTNPIAPLTINSVSGTDIRFSGGSNADISATTQFNISTSSTLMLNGNNIFLRTRGSDRLKVDNAGRVGIGTSSPSASSKFHVNSQASEFIVNNNSGGSGLVLAGAWLSSTLNPQVRYNGVSSGFIDIGLDASGSFVVEGNDTPRLTVMNAGNVGIGTSTPTSKLQVNGNIGLGNGATANNKAVVVYLTNNSGSSINSGAIVVASDAYGFDLASAANQTSVIGVLTEDCADGAVCAIAIAGIVTVNTDDQIPIAAGQHCVTSAFGGLAESTSAPNSGASIGVFLTTNIGNTNQVLLR
ncbi:MAG: hypothetical protein ACPGSL_03850, partial [Vicingaceae bacterium]